jgi:hypothetical protein
MKSREKLLLVVFCVLFGVIIGGGVLVFSIRKYHEISSDNEDLRTRIESMETTIAHGEEWESKSAWVHDNVPVFGSREEASSKLIAAIQKAAQSAGVTISAKEFLDEEKLLGAESAEETAQARVFEKASIKITLTGVSEKSLYTWMHSLQEPKAFLGITRLQIEPATQGKAVNCEVDIAQFYRSGQPPKLTKAN